MLGAFAAASLLLAAQDSLEKREVTVTSGPYALRLPTTFRTNARLVEAPVVVRNIKGEAVGGLKREDFEIRDQGKKRDISSFAVEVAERGASGTKAAAAAPAQPAPPAVKARTRWIALLFDDLNSNAADLLNARNAALRFMKEGLQPGNQVSVFTTYGRQMVPFTTDTAQIAAALSKLAPHPMKTGVNGCPTISTYEAYLIANTLDPTVFENKVDEARRCSGQPPPPQRRGKSSSVSTSSPDSVVQQVVQMSHSIWEQTMLISRNTLEEVGEIVNYLGQHPGDRLLVCASSGFLSGKLETEQDELINRALHAGVIIDSLDAKGLYVQDAPQIPMGGSARSVIVQQGMGTSPQESANDALAVMAYGTGGIFFHNNNDLTLGLREMMAPTTTYLLGFAPDAATDGKYHRLKVRVTAPGHYEIQSRPGYVAAPVTATAEAQPRKIDELVLAADTRSDAAASIASSIQTGEDGTKSAAATLHIDLKHMTFRELFGRRDQKIVFIAVLTDQQGNYITGKEYRIDLALKQDTYEKSAEGGFNATAILTAPKGKYRLRGVAEVGAGAITATTLEVEIP
jgi:VWFA-related protein